MTDEIRQRVYELFGLPYVDTPDGRAEYASYLAARAEADAQRAAYIEWANRKRAELAAEFTARWHTAGWLPDGARFEWVEAQL